MPCKMAVHEQGGILMTLDELETRLSGQCRNTVQYLAELHFGQDIGQRQQSEGQGVV